MTHFAHKFRRWVRVSCSRYCTLNSGIVHLLDASSHTVRSHLLLIKLYILRCVEQRRVLGAYSIYFTLVIDDSQCKILVNYFLWKTNMCNAGRVLDSVCIQLILIWHPLFISVNCQLLGLGMQVIVNGFWQSHVNLRNWSINLLSYTSIFHNMNYNVLLRLHIHNLRIYELLCLVIMFLVFYQGCFVSTSSLITAFWRVLSQLFYNLFWVIWSNLLCHWLWFGRLRCLYKLIDDFFTVVTGKWLIFKLNIIAHFSWLFNPFSSIIWLLCVWYILYLG